MAFHNPYHFVPVKSGERPDDLAVDGKAEHITHDRFVSRTTQAQPVYSGRLICRLTTEDPIVVGDRREELPDGSHRVFPFELDGKPALPASTLRGLISSIAEAASNSTLRVLEDRLFSYRAEMPGLSAIGMIVETTDENGVTTLWLRPLALPTMEGPHGGAIPLENRYHTMFPTDRTPPLKVYVGDQDQIRSDDFVPGLPFQSFSRACPQYCYAKLHSRAWNPNHTLSPDARQYRKPGGGKEFLLSQTTTDKLPPCLEGELPENEEERKLYTRGILRILGVPGREDIPNTKKHELFIPYPDDDVEGLPTFLILQSALDRFYELADERTEARKNAPLLPYEPRGTARNNATDNADDKRFRLKNGDLVYFRPDSQGDTVEEIALSAIWRREKGRSHDYFRRLSPELLPFHKDRQRLTVAEQLFGFVEQRQKGQDSPVPARALAGRLRFSFGLLHSAEDDHYEPEVLLKVLDSPKPPSPALYFKRANGQGEYIAKKDLNPQTYIPQGRKFYLHRYDRSTTPWKTFALQDNLKQKSRVRPIRSQRVFYFHIDFDNLSQRELALLCYAVRPTDSFRHKLGMGKPLGLGKVRIDPVGLFYINRQARYEESLLFVADRYHGNWLPGGEDRQQWPSRYEREKQQTGQNDPSFPSFDTLRESFRNSMDSDIRQALELLGDPQQVRRPVHTPQVAGGDMEKETYRWFVANDLRVAEAEREFLEPLNESSTRIEVLPEHPWNE